MQATARACLSRSVVVVALALAAGCGPYPWSVQSSTTFHLNPDGSGKAEVEAFLNFPLDLKPLEDETETHARVQRAVAANALRRVLVESKGVDAWRDVSWSIEADGRVRFAGEALFADMTRLSIASRKHAVVSLERAAFRETDDGGIEFVISPLKKAEKRAEQFRVAGQRREAGSSRARDMSGEEIARRMEDAREEYRARRPIFVTYASRMKTTIVFHLPGKVEEATPLVRTVDGGLKIGFDAMDYVRALDEFYADNARLRRHVAGHAHLDRRDLGNSITELVLGKMGVSTTRADERTERRAVLSGEMAPLFDYAAEVAQAKGEVDAPVRELGEIASLDAIRDGPGRAIWREYDPDAPETEGDSPSPELLYGPFRAGPYPWRGVKRRGLILSSWEGPDYFRYPYAEESAGSAHVVPQLVDLYGKDWRIPFASPSAYQVMVDCPDAVEGGARSARFAVSHIESGDESGTRTEYRLDLPGCFGFEGGSFDIDNRERTYVRFSNAFVMNTRAVASLDLGAAWLDSERDDARFEWGVSADVFPRKPWLVHLSWHALDGSDRPSETRAAVGVALKALEISAGWTRESTPAGNEDFLEYGARVWWAF